MGCHSQNKKTKNSEWHCISNCGACCRLCPDERIEALEVLNDKQKAQYLEMVLPNGWCRNYDSGSRSCRIYESRPDFCKVSCLGKIFHVPADMTDSFAIQCCRQQIRSTYGPRSRVLKRFEKKIRSPKAKK